MGRVALALLLVLAGFTFYVPVSPAAAQTRDSSKDFTLATANGYPTGIWSDGTTMWVADFHDTKVYGYSMSDRSRDEDQDISLDTSNNEPVGLWSDGVTLWVGDFWDARIYAYNLSTGARDAGKEFNTLVAAGNLQPEDFWSDGVTLWVADVIDDKVYAYNLTTRAKDADKEFTLSDGHNAPLGLWSDGITMWVTDWRDAKAYAYNLSTKAWDADKDFALDDDNADPEGLWSDGTTMWVADREDDGGNAKLFAYAMPRGVIVLPMALEVAEGGSAAYTMALNMAPTGDVTVDVTAAGDVSVDPTSLTFPSTNWSASQTVTVSVAQDDDAVIDAVTLQHSASSTDSDYSGISVADVQVTVPDDEIAAVTVSPMALVVAEGGSGTYTVRLSSEPSAGVTVDITAAGDVSVDPTSLTFMPLNWSTAQSVTVSAAHDDDETHDVQTVTHSIASTSAPEYAELTGLSGVEVTVGDDDASETHFDLAAVNANPWGIWSDGTTMWIGDDSDRKLYAYNLLIKARDEDKDFTSLDGSNRVPRGIWSNGNTMWVAEGGVAKLYAYRMSDGGRDAARDFDTLRAAGNTVPRGIWSNGSTMWVADSFDDKVYAYSMSTRARDSGRDFDTLADAGNGSVQGIWSNGSTMWVADSSDDKVYAYGLSTRARDADRDIDALVDAGNGSVQGIWSNGSTMWVADSSDDKVYAYGLPPGMSPADTTAPALSTAVVTGASLVLTYDEALDATSEPAASAFTVTVDGAARTVTHVSLSGRTATLVLDPAVVRGNRAISVTYSPPSGSPLRDVPGNAAEAFSEQSVTNATPNAPPVGLPVVTGKTLVQETLTVTVTGITDVDGLSDAVFRYRWFRSADPADPASDVEIASAVSMAYTLQPADEGALIRVRVTFTDGGGTEEILFSEPTATVAALVTTFDASSALEESGTVTIGVSTGGISLAGDETVELEFGGTATRGSDYRVDEEQLILLAGSSMVETTLRLLDDEVDDDGETIEITALHLGRTVGTQTVRIVDQDERGVMISKSALPVPEDGAETYTVVLTSEPTATVEVRLTLDPASSDVSAGPSLLAFTPADWDAPRTVTVSAADDSDAVADGSVAIRHEVSGGDYDSVTAAPVTVTIAENDVPTLSVADAEVSESGPAGDLAVVFQVELSIPSDNKVTADYATSDGSGLAGSDYEAATGTVSFPALSTTAQAIRVPVVDDEVDEAELETFTLTLSNVSGASLLGGGQTLMATGTIRDDDDPEVEASFEVSRYEAPEGGSVPVTVLLSADPERLVTIPLLRTPVGGITEHDYSGVPESVAFGLGQSVREFTFTATDDTADDDGEAVELRFGSLPPRVSGSGGTTLAIRDNDVSGGGDADSGGGSGGGGSPPDDDDEDDDPPPPPLPTVSVLAASASESAGAVVFDVRLSRTSSSAVTVGYATADGAGAAGAKAGSDYVATQGILRFPTGTSAQQIRVRVTDDEEDEAEVETFTLTLRGPVNATLAGGVSAQQVAGSIEDDDDPAVEASFGSSVYVAPEGGSVAVRVMLSGDPERELEIPLVVRHLDGASEADYSGVPELVTFESGVTTRTFEFAAVDDSEEDFGESVVIGFGVLPAGVRGVGSSTVSIEDDDTPPMAVIEVGGAECDRELCRALTGEAVQFTDLSTGPAKSRRWEFGEGTESSLRRLSHSWSEPGFYEVTLWVSDGARESRSSRVFLVESSTPAGTCASTTERRCLQDSRYAVAVEWRKPDGESGAGSVVHAGTNDSGLFTFFSRENWEILIKVLDGCAVNGHMWVFGASTTDLGYSIRVTDTVTGAVKEYRNEPGLPAAAITDATAFHACAR